jgi:hypothetical protein
METIKNLLIYKDVPITICMGELTPTEQYEVIRFILATRTKDVSICTHDITNKYIIELLQKLPVKFVRCFEEKVLLAEFPVDLK